MPTDRQPRQPSDALTWVLSLLIIAAAFAAFALPGRPADTVTLTRCTTAALTLAPAPTFTPAPAVPETPAPTAGSLMAAPRSASTDAPAEPASLTYVLNTNTKRFHKPDCSSVSTIKAKNRDSFTGSREELIDLGYRPCGVCKP